MSGPRTLPPFELLGVPIRVRCDDEEIEERLALCYDAAREGESASAEPLEASLARDGAGWRIRVDGRADRTAEDAMSAVRSFNHELVHGVMLRSPELYFVHAGVVAVDGRGLVLPGLSQAGKSTLVLALVAEGARFLSDELLAFEPGTCVARSFPRAIKIRDACAGYFPDFSTGFRGTGEGRFLSFAALPPDALIDEAPVGAIVVPRWSGSGRERLEPISAGRALLDLAGSSLNFGTHRVRSLDCLAAIVDGACTWRLAWSEPRAAARRMLAALDEAA